MEGLMLGLGPRKIAPQIRDALGVQLTRALTIARTEMLRANRTATQQTYTENANVVKGWTWSAALHGNTCPICFSKHGTEHALDEKLASHPNCRCTPSPLTYNWEEIGARYGFDWSDLDKDKTDWEKLAKKYNMSDKELAPIKLRAMKGEQSFKTLDPFEQQSILGKVRWQAWNIGKLVFDNVSGQTFDAMWGE
jgi:SPP1 gp7 family putative phage head morphogenesis protein